MGNWGLACKNCAKIKDAVNEGADTVLQRESADQEQHIHKVCAVAEALIDAASPRRRPVALSPSRIMNP